jgi:hypothetical protein
VTDKIKMCTMLDYSSWLSAIRNGTIIIITFDILQVDVSQSKANSLMIDNKQIDFDARPWIHIKIQWQNGENNDKKKLIQTSVVMHARVDHSKTQTFQRKFRSATEFFRYFSMFLSAVKTLEPIFVSCQVGFCQFTRNNKSIEKCKIEA